MPMASEAMQLVWKRPFTEQLDYFRAKLNLPTERWDDILGAAHDRAFVVAGAAKADLLQDLRHAVDATIAEGKSLQWFRSQFGAIVKRHGWDYTGSRDWRSRVIYTSNLSASYAAGRWAQLNDPALAKLKPFWRYVHSDSVLHPRPEHLAWHGLTLPRDDAWWRTHFPPNGWGCHCRVVAVSRREAEATPSALRTAPDEDVVTHVDAYGEAHEVPAGIDYGWGHAPGAGVDSTFSQLIAEKLIRWDARIGSAAFDEMSGVLVPQLTREFAPWADALTQARGQVRIVGALSQKVVGALARQGVAPASAHLAVRDADVLHTHRNAKTSKLPWDWYRELPTHVSAPQAVLLDRTEAQPALLYVFDIKGSAAKLVAKLDYEVGVRDAAGKRARVALNILRSGRLVNPQALNDPVSYELLEGTL